MKTKTIIAAMACIALAATSCSSNRYVAPAPAQPQEYTLNLALARTPQADKYANLEYGIRLNIQDGRSDKRLLQLYDAAATTRPKVHANPGIGSFIPEGMRRYMRVMGFNMDADVATDYLMQATIKEFHVDWLSGIGWQGTVIMDIKVFDHNRSIVYPTTEVAGRASVYSNASSFSAAQQAINQAFVNALDDVDWDRIAFFLHRSNDPSKEGNKKVQGEGNTALEHLIVHWEIDSRPHGADVEWRVVSETNEVKNQNWKYLGTTPYEGTKALGIEGLTYNNSGNVRIQVRVVKNGYGAQIRDYNLRAVVDEKEVSGFIRLNEE